MSRFLPLLAALMLSVFATEARAQALVERQVLTAPARGEGEPERYFGSDVAIDADLAVVREGFLGGRVRAYRRSGGQWQRALELDLQDPAHSPLGMSVSEGRLILTVGIGNSRRVRILRDAGNGWVEEFSSLVDRVDYGDSVAIDGLIAVVGDSAAGGGGAIYVLRSNGSGTWATTALTSTPRQNGAGFGQRVSIVAGAIVAAAPREDVGGVVDAGAAYVFELTGSTWSQVSRLTSPSPIADERFGSGVAISGLDPAIPDRLLIGTQGGSIAGRVHAHRRGTGTWPYSFTIEPPVVEAGSQFGTRISMDGDVALLGAPFLDGDGGSETGAVWGVDFNSQFTSAVLTRRTDPQAEIDTRFGNAVAIDRDGPTALVGAPRSDQHGHLSGVVLMSTGSSGQPFPALQRVFALGRSPAYSEFGAALDSDGDHLIVGAPLEALGSEDGTGAVYFYRRAPDASWELAQRLPSPQGQAGDRFGEAVALRGDLALVGAPGVDPGGTDAGAVYVYRRSNGVWNIDRLLGTQCTSAQRREFGRRLAFDGTRAMIGGICPGSGGGIDLGTHIATRQGDGAWTYALVENALRMSSGGWDNGLAIFGVHIAQGDTVFSGFVHSYAYDGTQWDFVGLLDNGNATPTPQGYGYDVSVDQGLLAAASYRANTAVTVRRRVGDDFLPESTLLPAGLGVDEPLWAVAVDGAAERIAVGTPQHSVDLTREGAVFVFERQLGTWQQTQRLRAASPATQAAFGNELAYASDGSLLIGAPRASPRFRYEGAVHIFGNPSNEVFRDGFE